MKQIYGFTVFVLLNQFSLEIYAENNYLPFSEGESWYLTRGFNDATHKDYGSKWTDDKYALDFAPGGCGACWGKPILAMQAGEVEQIGTDSWGNTIFIKLKNNHIQRYSHLKDILVEEGDKIQQGRKIGTCGNTGNIETSCSNEGKEGSHIHIAEYDESDNGIVIKFVENKNGNFIPWNLYPSSNTPHLSFHKEQGNSSIYQFRTDQRLRRYWPIFNWDIFIVLAGTETPTIDETHPSRSLKQQYRIAPRIGQIGTLFKIKGDETVWIVIEAYADPDEQVYLGKKRHLNSDAFLNAFLWKREEDEETKQYSNVLEVKQNVVDLYETEEGLFEQNDVLSLVGIDTNGVYHPVFKIKYDLIKNSGNDLGLPFDNEGGIVVHNVEGVVIQDYKQPDLTQIHYGNDGETALMLNPQETVAYLVKEGFWQWYKDNDGFVALGAPLSDEYNEEGMTFQDFEGGRLQWDGSNVSRASSQVHIVGGIEGTEPVEGTISTIIDNLYHPNGVFVDDAGNLFIADTEHHRVYKRDNAGNVVPFAGDGTRGNPGEGDGGLATSARLAWPTSVSADASGNIYILDHATGRVRKVDISGNISSVVSSYLGGPAGLSVDDAGNIYVADTRNQVIRKFDPAGNMSIIAGNGSKGFSGDGGSATDAQLEDPHGVFAGTGGTVYIVDSGNDRIRKVDTSGIISTVAGTENRGFAGDGGPATSAQLGAPISAFVDNDGNLFIADRDNHRIRKVDTAGIITTVVGSSPGQGEGNGGLAGDGGLATDAELNSPRGVAVGADGTIYIADTFNNRVRKVIPITDTPDSPELRLTVLETNFGDVQVGSSGSISFDIENTGTVQLTVSSITSDDSQFHIIPPLPYAIPTSVNQSVVVSFEPAQIGTTSTRLTINHNASQDPVYLRLSGVGLQPIINLSANSLDFGDVVIGTSLQRILRVSNTGNALLTVSGITKTGANPGLFWVTPTSFSIDPDGNQQVTVTFTPASETSASAMLSIQHDADGGTSEVNLSGTGVSLPPNIQLTADALSYKAIQLAWDADLEQWLEYQIERKAESEVVFSLLKVIGSGSTQYLDQGNIVGLTEYWYRIRGIDVAGHSHYSNEAHTTTHSDLLGDVNNDGKVNITDALIVATYDINPDVVAPNHGAIELGDVNYSDNVSITDALIIATYDIAPDNPNLPLGIAESIFSSLPEP